MQQPRHDSQGSDPEQVIDKLCDEFENGWLSDTPVPLERVVETAPEELREELFRNLLPIELEYLSKMKRPLTPDEARDRFLVLGPWAEAAIREQFAETDEYLPPSRRPGDAPTHPPQSYIGKYEVVAELGRGANGIVYKAFHPHLRCYCAVKVLIPPSSQKPEELRRYRRNVIRFRREWTVLARSRHPNVVQAMDAGEQKKSLYLVMEYVEGENLGRIVRAQSRLAAPDACEMVRQAAEGLAHIDSNKVVHRDVKPNNLLLGVDGIVRVVDLGLARLPEPLPGEYPTETGLLMGTPDFMAPEQIRGSRIDIRADVYSLGCTLYALLAGAPPFSGPEFNNAFKKFQAHTEAPVPPLASRCPDLPAGLEDLVLRMLRKDPAERIASPAEVAREIAPFCLGHDLPRLVPPAPPDPVSRPTVTGGEPAPRVASLIRPVPDVTTLTQVPEPPARSHRLVRGLVGLALAAVAGIAIWLLSRPTHEDTPPPKTGLRTFIPGEWTELLDREPEVLAWPSHTQNASWSLESRGTDGAKQLRVSCDGIGRGMLKLGEVDAPAYELKATLSQIPWVGGVGVFVRGRTDQDKDGVFTVTDGFLFQPFDRNDLPVKLHRAIIRIYPSRQTVTDWQLSSQVPRPRGGEHTVTIGVGPGGPRYVLVDDQVIAGGMFDVFGQGLLSPFLGERHRAGAAGSFGICVENSHAVFTSVMIRVQPNGEQP